MSSNAAERLVADRWTLRAALGRGPAGGVAWRAADMGGQPLAVEELELPASLPPADRPALLAGAAGAARAAAAIGHPAVVGLRDLVVEGDRVYLATDPVDALSIEELVGRHGPLPARRVAQLGVEVLDALAAAHRAGLAHLDLHPGNVLVGGDGHVRVAGFGLAALRDALAGPAADAFRAPEQLRGDPAGPPADLWALGAVLYLAVEGAAPFGDGATPAAAAVLGERPRPAVRAGQLTPALAALLTKPVAGRPTVADTRRLLERAGGHAPAAGAATPAGRPAGPPAPDGTVVLDRPVTPGRAAAHRGMDPALRRGLLVAGGSVLLGLLAFAAAVAVIGDPVGLRARQAPATVAVATTTPPTTVAPTTTAAAVPAVVPAGWAVYTEPRSGYRIAYPPGWEIVRERDTRIELHDRAGPTFLRIDWQRGAQVDPLTAEQQAGEVHAAEHPDGYRLARVEPSPFKGLPGALLEFTYQDQETWHALELGVRTPSYLLSMAIYSRDRDWGQGGALFEAFKGSLVPPPA
jgi:hypothetical protein